MDHEEVTGISWNPDVHSCVCNNPLLTLILSQMNPFVALVFLEDPF
jgi:hypothetical protein